MHIDGSDKQYLDDDQMIPSGKTTMVTQRFTDRLVDKVFLWMFPRSVHPNHLTIARFILTPVVLVLMAYGLRGWAFTVFVIAICTDFIDGTMARTCNQITQLGMVLDPIADKLLIGAVLAWLGYEYSWRFSGNSFLNVVIPLILAFIVLELIVLAVGMGTAEKGERIRPSNVFGKSKMVIQSVAAVLFLTGGMFDIGTLLTVSLYMLWVAVVLAALSGAKHILERFSKGEPPTAAGA